MAKSIALYVMDLQIARHVMVRVNTPVGVAKDPETADYVTEAANSYVKSVKEKAALLLHARSATETVFVWNAMETVLDGTCLGLVNHILTIARLATVPDSVVHVVVAEKRIYGVGTVKELEK